MKSNSPTCRSLAEANLKELPRRFVFGPGEPAFEAIQEVFWSCAVELTCRLLVDAPYPGEVRIGREQAVVPMQAEQWGQLEDELGLSEPATRRDVRQLFAAQFCQHTKDPAMRARRPASLATRLSSRLLGFVLFACYLERVTRNGPLRTFAYQFNELTKVAQNELAWADIGAFDEVRVSQEFFDYAAVRIRQSDRLLWIPYHAFLKPLKARLAQLTVPVLPPAEGTPTPEPAAPSPPPEPAPTAAPAEVSWELMSELNRLREENDRLREQATGRLLVRVLQPLLGRQDDPPGAVTGALSGDSALACDLLHALLAALHESALEFYGRPGELLELQLPHPQFALDGTVPPATRDMSRGWFRVNRRGVRVSGRLLAPATVVPASGGR